MTNSSLIQLVAACIGIVGSLFFAIGVMRQSVEAMARVCGTSWDWNQSLIAALAKQKADYLFGGGFIVAAFVLQLVSFFPLGDPLLSQGQATHAPWVAGLLTILALVIAHAGSRRLSSHYQSQIEDWLDKKYNQGRTKTRSRAF